MISAISAFEAESSKGCTRRVGPVPDAVLFYLHPGIVAIHDQPDTQFRTQSMNLAGGFQTFEH
jgi:hypothetical protein